MRLMRGGFTPRIAGRPSSELETRDLPNRLIVDLTRNQLLYRPVVEPGQQVAFGDPLAVVGAAGGTLALPAPAGGVIGRVADDERSLTIESPAAAREAPSFSAQRYEHISRAEIVEILARGGVWPLLWSSRTRSMPSLDDAAGPRSVVVNFVLTEPYRARGKVVINRSWQSIVQGIRFLQRLLADYGSVEIILTSPDDPVARMIAADLSGYAWVRIHAVPLVYPIENPRILTDLVRAARSRDAWVAPGRGESGRGAPGRDGRGAATPSEDIWVVDAQGIAAVGACLAEGLPLHERIVVAGGPGRPDPKHYAVRIGTPLSHLFGEPERAGSGGGERPLLLRGGLLNGLPADESTDSVGYDDDAYFFLPRAGRREPFGFIRPGFDRSSYNRSFATQLTGGRDRHITASLRGERRACIACGLCEKVCPAGIMPQVIHRYLYRGLIEEAEKAGLDRCVECNLCTYVCPSKIELVEQFIHAKLEIQREKEEILAVEARSRGGEEEAT